jgi:hypothetical protein
MTKPKGQVNEKVDIKENRLLEIDPTKKLLEILLHDHSTNKNIIWGTDNYQGKKAASQITVQAITGKNGEVIMPRTQKDKALQKERTKTHAEVFTPAWVVEKQNSLADNGEFNKLKKKLSGSSVTPCSSSSVIPCSDTESQKSQALKAFLKRSWLEITCGEAPYITSRYDATTGEPIEPKQRVGFLDRKLQIINLFISQQTESSEQKWLDYVKTALKSCYGFDFQGDNVLLARENMLYTVCDFYKVQFKKELNALAILHELADIISWNVFQMDGLKFVTPLSCKELEVEVDVNNYSGGGFDMFDCDVKKEKRTVPCPGCAKNDNSKHNGTYALLKDWKNDETVQFWNEM